MSAFADQPASIKERLDAERFRRSAIAYDESSQPIIKAMCELRLLFTSPWMRYDAVGTFLQSGETWTDQSAKQLYEKYEETLRMLHRLCFKSDALIAALEGKK